MQRLILWGLWLSRLLVVSLIVVEILGGLNLLGFTTEFTWKGLLLQSTATLIGLEVIYWLVKKYKLSLNVSLPFLCFTLVLAADAIGDMAHLYGRFINYDQFMHAAGGFAAALLSTAIVYSIYQVKRNYKMPKVELALIGTGFAMLGSVVYEIEEYLEDFFTGSQRLGDGFDTANDLMLALFFGLIAALLVVNAPKLFMLNEQSK